MNTLTETQKSTLKEYAEQCNEGLLTANEFWRLCEFKTGLKFVALTQVLTELGLY